MSGCCEPQKKGAFKIGVVISLTGVAEPLGRPEKNSIELLEKKINAAGGISGRKVDFLIRDDESEPQRASQLASELLTKNKVSAIIGGSITSCTMAMIPIAERNKIPLVSCAAGTDITTPPRKWVFSVAPPSSLVVEKLLSYIQENLGKNKIALLYDATAYGATAVNELETKAQERGITLVSKESYGSADVDMTRQLRKISATDAQVLIIWGTNPGPAYIARNARDLGIDIPLIGSHGIANMDFIQLAGSAAEGVVFPAGRLLIPEAIPQGTKQKAVVEEFRSEYKKAYNEEISTFAAHGWDAALLVTEVMKRGRTNSQQLRDEIEKTRELVGVSGIFSISKTNHCGLHVEDLVMIRIENGRWTLGE